MRALPVIAAGPAHVRIRATPMCQYGPCLCVGTASDTGLAYVSIRATPVYMCSRDML